MIGFSVDCAQAGELKTKVSQVVHSVISQQKGAGCKFARQVRSCIHFSCGCIYEHSRTVVFPSDDSSDHDVTLTSISLVMVMALREWLY